MNRTSVIMMAFAGLLVLTIFGAGLFYVGRKIYTFLRLIIHSNSISHVPIFIVICAVFAISVAISFIPTSIIGMTIKKNLVWFAWFMVGSLLILLMFFLASDFALLIGRLLKVIASPTPQKALIAAGCMVFAFSACYIGYAVWSAKQIKHVSYNITINKLPSITNLNVVLISDTHLDYLNDEKWLAKIANNLNSQNPDIVFIAGDIFNNTFKNLQNPEESLKAFQEIKTKYGVYAVPGNHDGGETYPDMVDFLRRGGITMLQDEHIAIDGKFIVVGRIDPMPIGGGAEARKETAEVMAAANEDNPNKLPVIVIEHQPRDINEYGKDADLILAGHTHGGIFFPANIVTYLLYKQYHYGYVPETEGSPHVVVTSGVGLWGPPFRLGSANEVVSINIEFCD